MPNGGPDNCNNCKFISKHAGEQICMLRDVVIPNTHWTYCHDFVSSHSDVLVGFRTPTGPIYASGGFEAGAYVRIPWFQNCEPRINRSVRCEVCGKRVGNGIELETATATWGFCSRQHYLDWLDVLPGPT